MSISHMQTAGIDGVVSVSSQTVTLSSNVTSGDAIIVCVVAFGTGGAPTFTVTDSLGNSYTSTGGRVTRGFLAVEVFYATGISSGSCTVTVTPSVTSVISMSAGEYTALSLDSTSINSGTTAGPPGTGSNWSMFGASFSAPPEMIIAVTGTVGNTGAITGSGSPWVDRYNSGGVANANDIDVQDQVNASTSPNPSWSVTSNTATWGAVCVSFIPVILPPPTHQPSQQLYFDLPNYWSEYSTYAKVPFAQWYVPQAPLPRQQSQRIESLPVLDSWWEQFRHQPVPLGYVPLPPPTRQASQIIVTLPDLWQEWIAFAEGPFAQWYVPARAPSRQSSQRWDALPDPNDQWFRQHHIWPVPVTFVPSPIPPPTQAISQQLYYDLPDFNSIWWEQRYISPPRIIPIPSGILASQAGVFGIQGVVAGDSQVGFYRVQNNIEGYVAYVGASSPPDLTQPPAVFSTTLPVPISFNTPVSGTLTYYILVRRQDTYGLQSQNQHFTTLTIDQYGNIVLPPLSAPQQLSLIALAGQTFKAMAVYPGALTDPQPANNWKVWIKLNAPPVPGVDPFNLVPVNGVYLGSVFGPLTPGVYYVLVGVARSADNALSATLSGTITIAGPPAEVLPVPGGNQQP